MEGWYRWQGDHLLLWVKVQPRASRDEIVGPLGERLKVRITAPPVDGKANAHLARFLAKAFQVSPSAVTLVAGQSGRDKQLRVVSPKALPAAAAIPRPPSFGLSS